MTIPTRAKPYQTISGAAASRSNALECVNCGRGAAKEGVLPGVLIAFRSIVGDAIRNISCVASMVSRRLELALPHGSSPLATTIPFIDLQAQRRRLGEPLNQAIRAAVEGGQWVMGPQVAELEEKLAAFASVKHCIACANGTDALLIVLRAWNIGPGDAVFVPAFTFAAS